MVLVLDDDLDRLADFETLVADVDGWTIRCCVDAPSAIAELEQCLHEAVLISLDHDLYRQTESAADPGSGRDVAEYLSGQVPVCPVIVHSTNTDAAWGMFNCLTAARWQVELVHHLEQPNWIPDLWWPTAVRLAGHPKPGQGTEPTR